MAMRAEVERAKREPKPMVRIFDEGALVDEYECQTMEESITVNIVAVGGSLHG